MDCYDDDSWASGYAEGKIEVLSGLLLPIKDRVVAFQSGADQNALTDLLGLLDKWELIFDYTRSANDQ